MNKKRFILTVLVSSMTLCGCGKDITYPKEFAKTADSEEQTENEAAADTNRSSKVWVELSGSGAPLADGNYQDLAILTADTAGTDATIMLTDQSGNWKSVSREVMEASLGDKDNYHISSSVTELLASGKMTIEMNSLNVMLLDLDPNLTYSAEEYGACFNRLLKKNPGTALSMRTVDCDYNGPLTVSIEDNNGVTTKEIEGVKKRNLVILATGPAEEVTAYMKAFEKGAKSKKLDITSRYDVTTEAETEDESIVLISRGFQNDTKNTSGVDETDTSYNVNPVDISDYEEYENLDDSVQVMEYTGDCMDEDWKDRIYFSNVSDPESYAISNVIVQECMDDGTWKESALSLSVSLDQVPASDNDTGYCLSFGEQEALSGDYAVTIELSHPGADHNDSVRDVSASTMEYIKAMNGNDTEVFEKLMSYDLFASAIGDGLYSYSDQICYKANYLIVNM